MQTSHAFPGSEVELHPAVQVVLGGVHGACTSLQAHECSPAWATVGGTVTSESRAGASGNCSHTTPACRSSGKARGGRLGDSECLAPGVCKEQARQCPGWELSAAGESPADLGQGSSGTRSARGMDPGSRVCDGGWLCSFRQSPWVPAAQPQCARRCT